LKTIHYADYDLTTTDETADAVLAYARALALKDRSDTVHVSGIDRDGHPKDFDLLIGPSSQMIASTSDTDFEVVTDAASVAVIVARTEALAEEGRAVSSGSLEDFVDLEDYDTTNPETH
jgi:hypothetical protein